MITISDLAGDYIKKLSTEKMNKYKEPQGRIVFAKASTLSDSNLNSDCTAEEKPSDTQASTPTDKQGDKQGDNAGDKSTKKPAEKKTTEKQDDNSSGANPLNINIRLSVFIFMATLIFYYMM